MILVFFYGFLDKLLNNRIVLIDYNTAEFRLIFYTLNDKEFFQ